MVVVVWHSKWVESSLVSHLTLTSSSLTAMLNMSATGGVNISSKLLQSYHWELQKVVPVSKLLGVFIFLFSIMVTALLLNTSDREHGTCTQRKHTKHERLMNLISFAAQNHKHCGSPCVYKARSCTRQVMHIPC